MQPEKRYKLFFHLTPLDSNGFYTAAYVGKAKGHIDTGVQVVSNTTGGLANPTGYVHAQKTAVFSLVDDNTVFVSTDGHRLTLQNKIGSNSLSFIQAFIEFVLQEPISEIVGDEYDGLQGKKAYLVDYKNTKGEKQKATLTNGWDSFWRGVGDGIKKGYDEVSHNFSQAKTDWDTGHKWDAVGRAALGTVETAGAAAGAAVVAPAAIYGATSALTLASTTASLVAVPVVTSGSLVVTDAVATAASAATAAAPEAIMDYSTYKAAKGTYTLGKQFATQGWKAGWDDVGDDIKKDAEAWYEPFTKVKKDFDTGHFWDGMGNLALATMNSAMAAATVYSAGEAGVAFSSALADAGAEAGADTVAEGAGEGAATGQSTDAATGAGKVEDPEGGDEPQGKSEPEINNKETTYRRLKNMIERNTRDTKYGKAFADAGSKLLGGKTSAERDLDAMEKLPTKLEILDRSKLPPEMQDMDPEELGKEIQDMKPSRVKKLVKDGAIRRGKLSANEMEKFKSGISSVDRSKLPDNLKKLSPKGLREKLYKMNPEDLQDLEDKGAVKLLKSGVSSVDRSKLPDELKELSPKDLRETLNKMNPKDLKDLEEQGAVKLSDEKPDFNSKERLQEQTKNLMQKSKRYGKINRKLFENQAIKLVKESKLSDDDKFDLYKNMREKNDNLKDNKNFHKEYSKSIQKSSKLSDKDKVKHIGERIKDVQESNIQRTIHSIHSEPKEIFSSDPKRDLIKTLAKQRDDIVDESKNIDLKKDYYRYMSKNAYINGDDDASVKYDRKLKRLDENLRGQTEMDVEDANKESDNFHWIKANGMHNKIIENIKDSDLTPEQKIKYLTKAKEELDRKDNFNFADRQFSGKYSDEINKMKTKIKSDKIKFSKLPEDQKIDEYKKQYDQEMEKPLTKRHPQQYVKNIQESLRKMDSYDKLMKVINEDNALGLKVARGMHLDSETNYDLLKDITPKNDDEKLAWKKYYEASKKKLDNEINSQDLKDGLNEKIEMVRKRKKMALLQDKFVDDDVRVNIDNLMENAKENKSDIIKTIERSDVLSRKEKINALSKLKEKFEPEGAFRKDIERRIDLQKLGLDHGDVHDLPKDIIENINNDTNLDTFAKKMKMEDYQKALKLEKEFDGNPYHEIRSDVFEEAKNDTGLLRTRHGTKFDDVEGTLKALSKDTITEGKIIRSNDVFTINNLLDYSETAKNMGDDDLKNMYLKKAKEVFDKSNQISKPEGTEFNPREKVTLKESYGEDKPGFRDYVNKLLKSEDLTTQDMFDKIISDYHLSKDPDYQKFTDPEKVEDIIRRQTEWFANKELEGYSPDYTEMEKFYKRHTDEGFRIKDIGDILAATQRKTSGGTKAFMEKFLNKIGTTKGRGNLVNEHNLDSFLAKLEGLESVSDPEIQKAYIDAYKLSDSSGLEDPDIQDKFQDANRRGYGRNVKPMDEDILSNATDEQKVKFYQALKDAKPEPSALETYYGGFESRSYNYPFDKIPGDLDDYSFNERLKMYKDAYAKAVMNDPNKTLSEKLDTLKNDGEFDLHKIYKERNDELLNEYDADGNQKNLLDKYNDIEDSKLSPSEKARRLTDAVKEDHTTEVENERDGARKTYIKSAHRKILRNLDKMRGTDDAQRLHITRDMIEHYNTNDDLSGPKADYIESYYKIPDVDSSNLSSKLPSSKPSKDLDEMKTELKVLKKAINKFKTKEKRIKFIESYKNRNTDLQEFYKLLGKKYIEKLDPEKSINFDKPLSERGIRFADEQESKVEESKIDTPIKVYEIKRGKRLADVLLEDGLKAKSGLGQSVRFGSDDPDRIENLERKLLLSKEGNFDNIIKPDVSLKDEIELRREQIANQIDEQNQQRMNIGGLKGDLQDFMTKRSDFERKIGMREGLHESEGRRLAFIKNKQLNPKAKPFYPSKLNPKAKPFYPSKGSK